MGFAVVAGTGILLLAGVAAFGMVVVQMDAAADAEARAQDLAEERQLNKNLGDMTITQSQYLPGPDVLTIDVDNTGETTFVTADIDVLLDGVIRTDDVTWLRVGGSDVAYWAPGLSLEIRMDGITSAPGRVAIATGDGLLEFEVI